MVQVLLLHCLEPCSIQLLRQLFHRVCDYEQSTIVCERRCRPSPYLLLHLLKTLLRYIENRMGDTGYLCDTLMSTLASTYWWPSMTRLTLLPDVNNSVHLIKSPSAPIPTMVRSRLLLLRWSNAPLTFISSMPARFPSPQASCTILMILIIGSIALRFHLEAIWPSWSTRFFSYLSASTSATTFSHTFYM